MAHFTPQEIEQFLQEFFDVVGTRQYTGARYVPIFGRKDESSIEWNNTKPYEPLTIVLYQGNSFTSRQYVPIGVDILDTDYWANTGNYNAQVEAYREEVGRFTDSIKEKQFVFDTVTKMQESDNLYAGAVCKTNGFHSVDDGGGAYYKISESAIPNNMDVLVCGEFYATLLEPLCVTPEMFGAYGDNTHDDSASIQRAIDYANMSIGKSVSLLNKVYYCASSLEFYDSLGLDFHGVNGSGYNTLQTSMLRFSHSGLKLKHARACTFRNFCVYQLNTTENSIGIEYEYDAAYTSAGRCTMCTFEGVYIYNFDNGLVFNAATAYEHFLRCRIESCNIGVIFGNENISYILSPNYIYFTECSIGCKEIQFDLRKVEYVFIDKCDILLGIGINKTVGTQCNQIVVSNSVFWACTYPVYCTGNMSGLCIDKTNRIRISNKDGNTAIIPHGIYIHPASGSCTSLYLNLHVMLVMYDSATYSDTIIDTYNCIDSYMNCNFPYNYGTSEFPIIGSRPSNWKELIDAGIATVSIPDGTNQITTRLNCKFKPQRYELHRALPGTTEPQGELIRMASITWNGRDLTYTCTQNTGAALAATLFPVY